jgi:hypothetical protein
MRRWNAWLVKCQAPTLLAGGLSVLAGAVCQTTERVTVCTEVGMVDRACAGIWQHCYVKSRKPIYSLMIFARPGGTGARCWAQGVDGIQDKLEADLIAALRWIVRFCNGSTTAMGY